MKPSLSFYTNNPTPYQIDFFSALKNYFNLKVIYFTNRELDRTWDLKVTDPGYEVVTLNDNQLATLIQKKVVSFHFSFQIIKELVNDKADFILINGTYWTPNVLLSLFISKFRKKIIFYWNEPLFPINNRLKYYLQYFLLFPVRVCTNALMAIGQNGVDSYKKYGYKKPIYILPYNIDISLFSKTNLDTYKLNDLTAVYKSNCEVVFLTSGSLIHRKGMDTVIKAFLKIKENKNIRLLILGDGPDKEYLQQLSAAASERIHFLGFKEKEEVPYFFALSDIFIFASRYDGWALVINEAAAADLPIISSNKVGAAMDNLINGYNGFTCDAEDVDEFYKCMNLLITDKQKRKEIVLNMRPLKELLSSDYNAKMLYGICSLY